MKKTVKIEYTKKEIGDISFELNKNTSKIKRIGEYIVSHNGDMSGISNDIFVGWGKSIIECSDKILNSSGNLWPKSVQGDDDYNGN